MTNSSGTSRDAGSSDFGNLKAHGLRERVRLVSMNLTDFRSVLQVLTQAEDKDGTKHFRYQQTFRGVPIWGEQVIVSEDKSGNVKNLFGRMVGGLGK